LDESRNIAAPFGIHFPPFRLGNYGRIGVGTGRK